MSWTATLGKYLGRLGSKTTAELAALLTFIVTLSLVTGLIPAWLLDTVVVLIVLSAVLMGLASALINWVADKRVKIAKSRWLAHQAAQGIFPEDVDTARPPEEETLSAAGQQLLAGVLTRLGKAIEGRRPGEADPDEAEVADALAEELAEAEADPERLRPPG